MESHWVSGHPKESSTPHKHSSLQSCAALCRPAATVLMFTTPHCDIVAHKQFLVTQGHPPTPHKPGLGLSSIAMFAFHICDGAARTQRTARPIFTATATHLQVQRDRRCSHVGRTAECTKYPGSARPPPRAVRRMLSGKDPMRCFVAPDCSQREVPNTRPELTLSIILSGNSCTLRWAGKLLPRAAPICQQDTKLLLPQAPTFPVSLRRLTTGPS